MNPPPPAKEEPIPIIMPTGNARCFKTQNKSFVNVWDLPPIYDWNGIAEIDNGFYVLVSDAAVETAREDIMYLNAMIEKAITLVPEIPKHYFKENRIVTKFDAYAKVRRYCVMSFSSRTKTGKLPKHLITLSINYSDNLNGCISYGNDGIVSKAQIIISEHTRKETYNCVQKGIISYVINVAAAPNELYISAIYKNDNGRREKIYSSQDKRNIEH